MPKGRMSTGVPGLRGIANPASSPRKIQTGIIVGRTTPILMRERALFPSAECSHGRSEPDNGETQSARPQKEIKARNRARCSFPPARIGPADQQRSSSTYRLADCKIQPGRSELIAKATSSMFGCAIVLLQRSKPPDPRVDPAMNISLWNMIQMFVYACYHACNRSDCAGVSARIATSNVSTSPYPNRRQRSLLERGNRPLLSCTEEAKVGEFQVGIERFKWRFLSAPVLLAYSTSEALTERFLTGRITILYHNLFYKPFASGYIAKKCARAAALP